MGIFLRINNQKILRGIEFVLLFFGIPLIIYFDSRITYPVLLLLPFSLGILLYLWLNKDFNFKSLVRLNITRKEIWKNSVAVLITTLFLMAYVFFFERENLFNLPRKNTRIWLMLCIFYPLFSAYLQEIIFRVFLFTRYSSLFKKRFLLILASGIAFSFVHIVYYSPVSIISTFIAGIYLSLIYAKTGSVLFTTILHSIFGIIVFTIGLGHHFWLNMEKYL
jgi:uncharacterized protein